METWAAFSYQDEDSPDKNRGGGSIEGFALAAVECFKYKSCGVGLQFYFNLSIHVFSFPTAEKNGFLSL